MISVIRSDSEGMFNKTGERVLAHFIKTHALLSICTPAYLHI
jgi:hypothetical protein